MTFLDDVEDELDGLDVDESEPREDYLGTKRCARDGEVLALLQAGPRTTGQLIDALGLKRGNAGRILVLRSVNRLAKVWKITRRCKPGKEATWTLRAPRGEA